MIPVDLLAYRDNPRKRGGSKYANVHCEVDGQRFDSKAERDRWLQLRMLERAGEIRNLRRQVKYVLIEKQERPSGGIERECSYVADFVYLRHAGQHVVEDVKGAETPEFRIKRKLMLSVHGIEVAIVRA
jgi:hypothetical protein